MAKKNDEGENQVPPDSGTIQPRDSFGSQGSIQNHHSGNNSSSNSHISRRSSIGSQSTTGSVASSPPSTLQPNNNVIGEHDVLRGRGGLTNQHVGNKNFRFIVAEHVDEYLHAKKKEKKEIAHRIIHRVNANGGRFLRRCDNSNVWSEVTLKKAAEKTSQALREGLDVRRKTIRPEKQIHRRGSESSHEDNPRKRARLVEGVVMVSPVISVSPANKGMSSHTPDIPTLIHDHHGPHDSRLPAAFEPPLHRQHLYQPHGHHATYHFSSSHRGGVGRSYQPQSYQQQSSSRVPTSPVSVSSATKRPAATLRPAAVAKYYARVEEI